MQNVSLNFSLKDKKNLLKALEGKPTVLVTPPFELNRWKVDQSTVTLYNSGRVTIQGNDANEVKDWLLNALDLSPKIVLGLDEAGRGERTGPFVISAVLGDENRLRELRDSKKISNMQEKFSIVSKNSLAQVIVSLNAEYVDLLRERGLNLNEIEREIANSVVELFNALKEKKLSIKMDGAPLKGASGKIEFIVRGDDANSVVGAASVTAKNYRDHSADEKQRETWKNATN